MNLQDELTEAGYAVGSFDACVDASAWLGKETPDIAELYTAVKDGSCRALAAELARRDVEFVLWSGNLQDERTLHEFVDAVWVQKPSTHTALLDALARLRTEPQQQQA
jgi:hypothetical protein